MIQMIIMTLLMIMVMVGGDDGDNDDDEHGAGDFKTDHAIDVSKMTIE